MPTNATAPGKKWSLGIRKIDGRWLVEKPKGKLHRGLDPGKGEGDRDPDTIEWTLHADADDPEKEISAHFQFAHRDLVSGFTGRDDLTRDLTAVIPAPKGRLELKLKKDACRRKNPRYYAVWIRDETHPDGGEFAVGEDGNPPPEMEVGP
jgi:hypothetical protein